MKKKIQQISKTRYCRTPLFAEVTFLENATNGESANSRALFQQKKVVGRGEWIGFRQFVIHKGKYKKNPLKKHEKLQTRK